MRSAFVVIALAFVVALISLQRKAYPVHQSGVVLISGASKGIGKHAAEQLARKHPSLTVYAGVRKLADGDAITQVGLGNLKPLLLDVTDQESCVAAYLKIKAETSEKLPLVAIVVSTFKKLRF